MKKSLKAKQKLRQHLQQKRTLQILAPSFVLLLGVCVFVYRDNLQRAYYAQELKLSLQQQLKPLRGELEALGFKDLGDFKTDCQNGFEGTKQPITCTASLSTTVTIGNEPDRLRALNQQAEALAKKLNQEGWESRQDYATIDWFRAISQDIDYQPDQYNEKQLGNKSCVVDFFTAYSKPSPIAIQLQASCSRPKFSALKEL